MTQRAQTIAGLEAAIRAANLALFVIRKQGVMPNCSWDCGFNSDMETARAALAALRSAPAPDAPVGRRKWPRVFNVKRAENAWHGEISFARCPTDEELQALEVLLRDEPFMMLSCREAKRCLHMVPGCICEEDPTQ